MFLIKEQFVKPEQIFENLIKLSIFDNNKYFIFNRKSFLLLNQYLNLDIYNKIDMVEKCCLYS